MHAHVEYGEGFMKRILLSTVALVAFTAGASAADLPARMPVKAPVIVETIYTWTGPYIGIVGGGGWAESNFRSNNGAIRGNTSPDGGFVGGTLGYNWQFNNSFVVGLEGDIAWAGIRGSKTCAVGLTCKADQDWIGTVRGRLGYAAGSALFYVTGGYAVSDVKAKLTTANLSASQTKTRNGWTVGGGVEVGFWNNWSAKAEYLYADYGNENYFGGGSPFVRTKVKFNESLFRVGINYRFGGGWR